MITVALETSTRAASVALRTGRSQACASLTPERAHASDLLGRLDPLLRGEGLAPSDLQLVVAGTGPGSFTGLRVGIATALGLARGSGALLQGVPSVEALALGVLAPGEEGTVLLDARGGAFYLARYGREQDHVQELSGPRLCPTAELAAALPGTGVLIGEPGIERIAGLDDGQVARLVTDRVPQAEHVLLLGVRRLEREGPLRPEQLEPLYLRPFVGRPRSR